MRSSSARISSVASTGERSVSASPARSAALVASPRSRINDSLVGKWLKTVFSDTSQARAISDTRTASKPRSRNISVAVSESRCRSSRFFRSRRPSAPGAGS